MKHTCLLVVGLFLCGSAWAGANPLFRDHMVFPAGKTLRVFGTGTDSAKVRFLGHEASAACKDGRWLVELPAAEAGGPYELVIECDGVKTVVKDVWVGEVILLAGQSNMQFRLDQDTSADEPHPTNVLLRSYMIDRLEKHGMDKEADGWVVATPEAVRRWSAIGYHLGSIRTAQKKVAVGLVNCYQGASTIQTWMPKALAEDARFALPPGGKLHGDDSAPTYAVWNQPWGKLYETMFLKVVPFAFSQVVWYQGESNTGHLEGTVYADRLVAMIDRWRADLRDPALPFTLVQIADYQWRRDDDWRSVQAAQLTVPPRMTGVKTVRSADISDHEIHPSSKQPLAVRISDAMDPPRKNPAFPGLFSDPELLWSEQTGRCYIYPSTDGFPPDWREDKAYAFSSADMRTWRKDGCVFDLKRDCSWADIKLWAPCAIERRQPDGSWKYYWYFAAEQKLGVAVGERPEGPFRDALGHPLLAKHLDAKGRYYKLIDPDVFCDPQTGKCHLYWGNACMVRAELKPSMTEIGEPQFLIDRDTCVKFHYNEGTHVFFRKGLYYFSWSEFGTEDPRYCVRYLISDSPTEFVRNGKPAEVEPEPLVSRVEEKKILGTGHHSVVCKPGTDEWYVAYHRFCMPNVEKGGNPAFNREVCVDRLEFAPDGRIIRVTCTP